MKILYSWICDFIENPPPAEELAAKLCRIGLKVEELKKTGAAFTGVCVGRIDKIDKHPNADKLSLVDVFDGAATLLARRAGAVIVDPRDRFLGELLETFQKYPTIGPLVPAMGYSAAQQQDLEYTLNNVDAEIILSGTPINLAGLIHPDKPIVNVGYDLEEIEGEESLGAVLDAWLKQVGLLK